MLYNTQIFTDQAAVFLVASFVDCHMLQKANLFLPQLIMTQSRFTCAQQPPLVPHSFPRDVQPCIVLLHLHVVEGYRRATQPCTTAAGSPDGSTPMILTSGLSAFT